MSGWQDHTIVK